MDMNIHRKEKTGQRYGNLKIWDYIKCSIYTKCPIYEFAI